MVKEEEAEESYCWEGQAEEEEWDLGELGIGATEQEAYPAEKRPAH